MNDRWNARAWMWCNGNLCIFWAYSTAYNTQFGWLNPIVIVLNASNHKIRFFSILNKKEMHVNYHDCTKEMTIRQKERKWQNMQKWQWKTSCFFITFGNVTVWMLSRNGMRSVKIFSFPMYCSSSQLPNSSVCLGLVMSRPAQTATSTENSKYFNIIHVD